MGIFATAARKHGRPAPSARPQYRDHAEEIAAALGQRDRDKEHPWYIAQNTDQAAKLRALCHPLRKD